MEWLDGFAADAVQLRRVAGSKGTVPRRNGVGIVVAIRMTLPCAHRLVGLCRNLLRLQPSPAWRSRSLTHVTPARAGDLPRTCSFRVPRLRWRRPVSPAHRPLLLPSSSTKRSVHSRARCRAPRSTGNHRPITFRPRSFELPRRLPPLRSRGHVASRSGPGVRRVARCSHRHRSGWCTSAIPASPSPYEELPSQMSVPCLQGRFPLAVKLRP